MSKYIDKIEELAACLTISQSDGYAQILRLCQAAKEEEELKKFAEKYNWELEVWHGEYKGVLCGVQETNFGEDPLPLYRFPSGVSLA